ncbi:hypothetical protein PRIC2_010995 [Phytophthora ramorum]
MKPSIVFDALSTGNYTARAVITNVEDGGIWYHESPDTTFSIVSETLATRASDSSDLLNAMGLLEWATLEQAMGTDGRNEKKETTSSILPGLMTTDGKSEYLLVVGVKTAVVENFALRQAIRHTWASVNALPPDVKVIFVGCAPALTALQSADEQEHIRKAVDLEKQTYGDLLTDELHCEDSYDDLPNKVKEFLRFTTEAFPQTPFVMVADDDIYLRADRLADELRKEGRSERLYIGQVWDELLGRRQIPVRNTTERYYVSEKSYPLHAYPPFAFGPHYLLSMDCARFIAKNRDRLHGLASTSFGERLNHTPMALLTASATTYPEVTTERQFCAYLYARCDRPQREYMFDLLNALEPVDALGVCAGSSRRPDPLRSTSRYSTWYNDDAVTTFQRYKFVIAFENGAVPGYVTEKLVNPFLAGSIPIYLGSPSVSELFNPDSFIDCGLFKKLADCAAYVMKVHNSPELYARMRREPPIRNMTAFKEAFSWHPSVQSRSLADNVARILAS